MSTQRQNIWQWLFPGAMAAQAIYVVAKLGIADQLQDGRRSIDELANATNSDSHSLYRVLRALTSIDIFKESEPRIFENTEMSNMLRSNVEGSARAWPLFLIAPFNWKLWGGLEHAVASGEPASFHVFGKDFWSHLAENPEDEAAFNAAMSAGSGMASDAIAAAYDFSGCETVVDVGGGHGRLLHGILSKTPSARGILFDLPGVVAKATYLKEEVAAGRAQIRAGSFFEEVPSGGDVYTLSGIIHDWSDEKAIIILKNCRRAIQPTGRLLITGSILNDTRQAADPSAFMDIYMMLLGGRERTEAEFRSLLASAGFSIRRIIPTAVSPFIIECEPV